MSLELRVEALEQAVLQLSQLVEQLCERTGIAEPSAPTPVPSAGTGVLARGKYIGKQRDWVVQNDPGYVVYLSELGAHVLDKWGFTEQQLEEAKARRNCEPQQQRLTQPARRPAPSYSPRDEEDDIPF